MRRLQERGGGSRTTGHTDGRRPDCPDDDGTPSPVDRLSFIIRLIAAQ